MKTDRILQAVTEDGVKIAARVQGEGPPLVFVHGALDDGELDWGALLPFLRDRFACHVLSMRGRGPSGDGSDHSPGRLARDIATYIETVGEPCGLVGLSGGGMLSLGAAARSETVSAVAVYEPIALEAIDPEFEARFGDLVARMDEAVSDGRPVEAARLFLEFVGNDAEVAALDKPDSLEITARNLAVDLVEFRQATEPGDPSPTGPGPLEKIAAPVLLMHGTQTAQEWFTRSVRYYAYNIPGSQIRQFPGAGHLGPIMEPERVAGELVRFLRVRLKWGISASGDRNGV